MCLARTRVHTQTHTHTHTEGVFSPFMCLHWLVSYMAWEFSNSHPFGVPSLIWVGPKFLQSWPSHMGGHLWGHSGVLCPRSVCRPWYFLGSHLPPFGNPRVRCQATVSPPLEDACEALRGIPLKSFPWTWRQWHTLMCTPMFLKLGEGCHSQHTEAFQRVLFGSSLVAQRG